MSIFGLNFPIQNIVLRISKRKNSKKYSLQGLFFLCFWQNVYRSAVIPTSLTWKISSWAPALRHYSFCKMFHLNWKCSECVCRDNNAVICAVTLCCVHHQTLRILVYLGLCFFRYVSTYSIISRTLYKKDWLLLMILL